MELDLRHKKLLIHFLEFIHTKYCINLRCRGLLQGGKAGLELQLNAATHGSCRLQELDAPEARRLVEFCIAPGK